MKDLYGEPKWSHQGQIGADERKCLETVGAESVQLTNPYESPQAAQLRRRLVTYHGVSLRKEFVRGGKFGAKVMAVALGSVLAFIWITVAYHFVRSWLSNDIKNMSIPAINELLATASVQLLLLGVASMFSALVGAMMMGTAALFRRARLRKKIAEQACD